MEEEDKREAEEAEEEEGGGGERGEGASREIEGGGKRGENTQCGGERLLVGVALIVLKILCGIYLPIALPYHISAVYNL